MDPKFSIDNEGRIFTSDPTNRLDREEVAQYSLIVVATDLAGQKVGSAVKGDAAYPKTEEECVMGVASNTIPALSWTHYSKCI